MNNNPDTGPKPDAGDAGNNWGKVVIVHASPYLFNAKGGGVRFCFATSKGDGGATVSPLLALPADDKASAAAGLPFPGVFPGTGGALPALLDLAQINVTAYAVDAEKIKAEVNSAAAPKSCQDLIGPTGTGGTLTPGTDYFQIGTIPAGTLQHSTTTLGVLSGCQKGATDTPTIGKCGGAAYAAITDPKGNLGVQMAPLDRATASGTTGYQFAHVSLPWDVVVGQGATQVGATYAGTVGFFQQYSADAGPDGSGAWVTITQPVGPEKASTTPLLTIKPATAAQQANLGAVPHGTRFTVLAVDGDGGAIVNPLTGAPIAAFGIPLDNIEQLTYGANSIADGGIGNIYANGMNYTFILVGDPDPNTPQLGQTDDAGKPTYNGYGVHFLAFPNDPPLPAP